MFLIGIVETCRDYGLANILSIVQRAMNLMQILVPIIAMIGLTKLLITLVIDPDKSMLEMNKKKMKNGFKNWIMALVIFFFLPFIIDAVMQMLDKNFSFAQCWSYAREAAASFIITKF